VIAPVPDQDAEAPDEADGGIRRGVRITVDVVPVWAGPGA
jgi:hypothetical protein